MYVCMHVCMYALLPVPFSLVSLVCCRVDLFSFEGFEPRLASVLNLVMFSVCELVGHRTYGGC